MQKYIPVKNDFFNKGISYDHCAFFVRNMTISHIFMESHWSKQAWFSSLLGVVSNSHYFRYVSFLEWSERNIICACEHVIVHALALCYEI